MLANRTKVESKAINVIRDLVDLSDRLLPDPNFGDKGISTDGFIQLFKNENVDIGENLLRQIPIQIKGRTDKTKKLTHIHKNSFKENVAVKDLENYSRFGGAIYFYVYFNNSFEIHSVYYSVLMPVKCRSYLTVAQKANTKEVAVSFTKLEETGRAIYEICAQFYEEQKKQGFGDGAIIEHIVSWNDLKGETTLSASAVGATDMVDFFKRIVRGDIHLYATVGSFDLPMEWSEGGVIVQHIRYDFPVMVGGKKYFDYIDVELSIMVQLSRQKSEIFIMN